MTKKYSCRNKLNNLNEINKIMKRISKHWNRNWITKLKSKWIQRRPWSKSRTNRKIHRPTKRTKTKDWEMYNNNWSKSKRNQTNYKHSSTKSRNRIRTQRDILLQFKVTLTRWNNSIVLRNLTKATRTTSNTSWLQNRM